MNYEINLLNHVGVVAKRECVAAAAAHEGDDNTPSGGVKIIKTYLRAAPTDLSLNSVSHNL